VLHRGTVAAAWISIAAGSLAGILILGYRLFVGQPRPPEKPQFPLRRILAFGAFSWATNFFIYILSDSTDVLLLGSLTTDRVAIGRYAACARIVFSLTSLLLGWTSLVGVASLSESFQQAGLAGLTQAVESVWKFGVFCLVPSLIFVFRYARPIVATLFSAAYVPAATIVQILAGLVVCGAFCGFSVHGGILYVLNRERLACAVVGGAALFNIASEVSLVRRFGFAGAAWATGASFFLLAASCNVASRRFVQLRVPVEFFAKISLAAGIGLLVSAWLQPQTPLQLIGAGALYGFGFVVSLVLFKPLTIIESASLGRVNRALGAWANRLFTTPYPSAQSGGR
jgi:O-antigen/teichoic acid export membrane protein